MPTDPPKQKRPQSMSSTGKVVGVVADQANWRTKLQQSRLKFDDVQKKIFLDHLSEFGFKGAAAAAAGITLNTIHNHLKNDPDFEEAMGVATQTYADTIGNRIRDIAKNGGKTEFFDKDGNLTSSRSEVNTRILELEAKRTNEDYRDKQSIDLSATGGGVLVAPIGVTPDKWITDQGDANTEKPKPGAEDVKK